MRFSIWPAAQQPFADVLRIARHAADTGWDGVWFADHFMPNAGVMPPGTPVLEAGSVVAALAASVPRVRIGTLVYGNTYRHPAVVANMAATVDRISEGRFTLGLGAGWQVNEHEQYGIPLPGTRELIDRFEEALQVVRGLLTRPTTSFSGQHYTLTDAVSEPKPVQEPLPILIGASGEQRMLGIVAKYADAWNTWGLPELIAHKSAVLDQHCEKIGRDPATIARTAQAQVFVGAGGDERAAAARMPAYGGTAGQLAEVVAGYAAIGVDELIVPTGPLGDASAAIEAMDLLRTEVFPAA
jgi:F420-dependent oxidoreductase-like protein